MQPKIPIRALGVLANQCPDPYSPRMPITIYHSETCGLCPKAMDWFREQNLPFDAKTVVYDPSANEFVDSENTREMNERCGGIAPFVPQIFINDRHISGYRTLQPMIASGEIFDILKEAGFEIEKSAE